MDSVDAILHFEGIILWMYLDGVSVVTTGPGLALFTVQDALALPWYSAPDVVKKDYGAVLTAPVGNTAAWYEGLTTSRLPETFIRTAAEQKLQEFRKKFSAHFPSYSSYPDPVRQALDDLMYNLGPHWPVVKKNGKLVWPRLSAAVAERNWSVAAEQSHRPQVSKERNEYVSSLFESAA